MSRLPIVSAHAEPHKAPAHALSTPRSLPTAMALERLWAEVAKLPLWLPNNLWRFGKVAWRTRTKRLDVNALRVVAPDGKRNDCGACTESCCVGNTQRVLLRLRDIGNLMDVGRTDLMQKNKPRFVPGEVATRPALRAHLRSRAWSIFPVLRQNSFGACEALNAAGQCTLYPHWPLSCARFPYAIDLEAAEIFYSQRCRSFFIHPMNRTFVQQMAATAVAGYNERIKDALLLEFKRDALGDLGLLQHLSLAAPDKP